MTKTKTPTRKKKAILPERNGPSCSKNGILGFTNKEIEKMTKKSASKNKLKTVAYGIKYKNKLLCITSKSKITVQDWAEFNELKAPYKIIRVRITEV